MKAKNAALALSCILACSAIFCSCGKEKEFTIDPSLSDSGMEEETAMQPVVTQQPDETATDAPTNDANEAPSDSGLMNVVNKVRESVEWAMLDSITDNDMAKEFFKLDLENPDYKDIIIMQCPMSAVTAEIIIIETDNVDAAKADLEARKEKLINVDAFYPDAKEIAENSIVGTYNKIAYFIAGENADPSEDALLSALAEAGY